MFGRFRSRLRRPLPPFAHPDRCLLGLLGGFISLLVFFSWMRTPCFLLNQRGKKIQNPPTFRASYEDRLTKELVVFMTTHLSPEHLFALRHVWPTLLQSNLFRKADFILYSQRDVPSDIQQLFQFQQIHRYNTTSNLDKFAIKQQGSMGAMKNAINGQCFANYTWVLRLNPDVWISNDTDIRRFMADSAVDGVFVDCHHWKGCQRHCTQAMINTDFFLVRTRFLQRTEPPRRPFLHFHVNAEKQATIAFKEVVDGGRDRWIWSKKSGGCRTQNPNIIHVHKTLQWLNYMNSTEGGEGIFNWLRRQKDRMQLLEAKSRKKVQKYCHCIGPKI